MRTSTHANDRQQCAENGSQASQGFAHLNAKPHDTPAG
jgi:hypothetical protein